MAIEVSEHLIISHFLFKKSIDSNLTGGSHAEISSGDQNSVSTENNYTNNVSASNQKSRHKKRKNTVTKKHASSKLQFNSLATP